MYKKLLQLLVKPMDIANHMIEQMSWSVKDNKRQGAESTRQSLSDCGGNAAARYIHSEIPNFCEEHDLDFWNRWGITVRTLWFEGRA